MTAPESNPIGKELGWLATLLLAAVVCSFLLFKWLAVDDERSQQLAPRDSVDDKVIEGEVGVVDGEVGIVDNSVGSRTDQIAGILATLKALGHIP